VDPEFLVSRPRKKKKEKSFVSLCLGGENSELRSQIFDFRFSISDRYLTPTRAIAREKKKGKTLSYPPFQATSAGTK
jgi:hypothetical protein